jgi:hypothetical protein
VFFKLINPMAYRFGVSMLLALLLGMLSGIVKASETTERRIQISLSLFPRVVAVDNGFREKLTEASAARLVFAYVADEVKAKDLVAELKQSTTNVAGLPLQAVAVTIDQQVAAESITPTAIFITERLSRSAFNLLLSYASDKHILVFSPFSGDVERGAMVGISVTSRVRPYFNVRSLEQAGISINAILMNISVRYE